MAAQIRLGVLGPVSVATADGEELPSVVAQPRRTALLVYLALTQQRGAQQRDTLLALFWPDYDEQRARNSLNQAVHFLRRTLGADAVISRGDDQLLLDPGFVWCDALEFEARLDAGRTADALALYRGRFLEGFHVSDAAPDLERWLDGERDRLARRYARALEQMAAQLDAAGDPAGAAVWWRRLAEQDPLASHAALGLMRALAAAGEPATALQHARIHEALVREELQADVDPQIAAFARELQRPNGGGNGHGASNGGSGTATPARANVVAVATASNGDARLERNGGDGQGDDGGAGGTPAPHGSTPRPRRFRRANRLAAFGMVGVVVLAVALLLAARRDRGADANIGCVAVLPIENLSRDSAFEAVADALTDETITELARFERPRVISWTSVMQYRRTRKPLPEIGRALNCDGALEGGITRDGRVVRVHVQMFDAPQERHLWAESYDGDTSDLMGLEIRVAESVARHLAPIAALTAPPGAAARRTDPVVYGIYLRGRDAFRSRNAASLRDAAALFRQVIVLDSSFAAGYAGLSDTYEFQGASGFGSPALLDSAHDLARRALAVDSNSSEAHVSMSAVYIENYDWVRAEAEFQRAIQLEPGNALAHHWYAMLLRVEERREDAVREIRRAAELDPLSDALMSVKGGIEVWAGVSSARGKGGPKDMMDPTHASSLEWWAVVRAHQHRCPEAYDLQRRADELAPDNSLMMTGHVGVNLSCGKPAEARSLLTTVERRPDAPLMGLYIAQIFAGQGQRDSAFYWLDRARWVLGTLFELRSAGRIKPLRSDPRYAQLLAHVGLR